MRWPLDRAISAALACAFLAYFGAHAYRYAWVGDIHSYVAGVSALFEDLARPRHEAVDAPGTTSIVYTPYLVGVAALGRALALTPYGALQLAAIFNLLLYLYGAFELFRARSVHARPYLAASLFLVVSLLLRVHVYLWSSDTSYFGLRVVMAYPSTFAWGAIMLAFARATRFLARGRATDLVIVCAALAVCVPSHLISGSWALLTLGVFALMAWRRPRRALGLGLPITIAITAVALWPYGDLLGHRAMSGYTEGAPFGRRPFAMMGNLYGVAAIALLWALLTRRASAYLLPFLATVGALFTLQALGVSFGDRYAYYAAFWAQVLVADAAAFGLRPAAHPAARALLALVLVLSFTSPALRNARGERRLLGPIELARAPSSHDAYQARFAPFTPELDARALVIAPNIHEVYEVAARTGARFLSCPYALRVPDREDRERELERFFAGDAAIRAEIMDRRGARFVLVPEAHGSRGALEAWLGPPIATASGLALFRR